ncbi:hypothetical protein LCGC14_1575620 [marine sediment metagenome]|uniref:Uncharacterized protein n=1 Tax=marine sediment metagenome TaxID=412755 RepID=A0A0F9J4J8_9ZZZZ
MMVREKYEHYLRREEDIVITRHEFLRLPLETRREILSRQAEDFEKCNPNYYKD